MVEDKLFICAVGDGTLVRLTASVGLRVVLQHANGQPQSFVRGQRGFGVASREVIVHGDHVHAASAPGFERRGQDRRDRLALASRQFRAAPGRHHQPAEHLLVMQREPELAPNNLVDRRERIIDDRGARAVPLPGPVADRSDTRRLRDIFDASVERTLAEGPQLSCLGDDAMRPFVVEPCFAPRSDRADRALAQTVQPFVRLGPRKRARQGTPQPPSASGRRVAGDHDLSAHHAHGALLNINCSTKTAQEAPVYFRINCHAEP